MRIAKLIISTLFIVAIVTFATSNREEMTISLWPFNYELALSISTSIILFIFIGFILGSLSSWIFGSGTRRLLKVEKKAVKNSNKEIRNKDKELSKKDKEINNLNNQITLLEEQIKLLESKKTEK